MYHYKRFVITNISLEGNWTRMLIPYFIDNKQMRLLTVKLILKAVKYDQQKIHTKSFSNVFMTKKTAFGAILRLISSLALSFFKKYRMDRPRICNCWWTTLANVKLQNKHQVIENMTGDTHWVIKNC